MSKKLYIINGPNLNLLGTREPEKYGNISLDKIKNLCSEKCNYHNLDLNFFQSNIEGELIEEIHKAIEDGQGIIINAGAYTHTSIALRDALLGVAIPYVEVHLSNIYSREEFRHKSFLSDKALGLVCGFGANSYQLALEGIVSYLKRV